MVYEVVSSREAPHSAYVVRAIDSEQDGLIYLALFEEGKAKERAEECATWKNAR